MGNEETPAKDTAAESAEEFERDAVPQDLQKAPSPARVRQPVNVVVEIILPSGPVSEHEVAATDIGVQIEDLDVTTTGSVPVRHANIGAIVALHGLSSNPDALARHPQVVGVWVDDKPLWDRVDADDASRYAF